MHIYWTWWNLLSELSLIFDGNVVGQWRTQALDPHESKKMIVFLFPENTFIPSKTDPGWHQENLVSINFQLLLMEFKNVLTADSKCLSRNAQNLLAV